MTNIIEEPDYKELLMALLYSERKTRKIVSLQDISFCASLYADVEVCILNDPSGVEINLISTGEKVQKERLEKLLPDVKKNFPSLTDYEARKYAQKMLT